VLPVGRRVRPGASRLPYMLHCQLLRHEDQGMMGQFIVADDPRTQHPQRIHADQASHDGRDDYRVDEQWTPSHPLDDKVRGATPLMPATMIIAAPVIRPALTDA
jgi:hypothetical protein